MSTSNEGDKSNATGDAFAPSFSTLSPSLPVPKVSVVSQQRKEELLLIARAERRRWIEKVPLPYCPENYHQQQHRQVSDSAYSGSAGNHGSNLGNDLWASTGTSSTTTSGSLCKIKSSLVCQKYLPSATAVISELYGLPTSSSFSASSSNNKPFSSSSPATKNGPLGFMQVAERVETLVKPYLDSEGTESSPQFFSPTVDGDVDATNKDDRIGNSQQNPDITVDPAVVQAYQDFWTSLLWPESSVIVQGMKNFLFHWKQNHFGDDSDRSLSMIAAASSLNGYCKSTVDSLLKSNQNLVGSREDSSKLRRSLESLVYGQVRDFMWSKIEELLVSHPQKKNGNDAEPISPMTPAQLEERLLELQFVQPSHLEIACLEDSVEEDASEDSNEKLQKLLKEPIRALLSMDAYHSPFEKLQQILLVYQGVNTALLTALNEDKTGPSVLPSADDVLPTIILVCIKARPRNLLHNLQFVELFAVPEYLRGEAGYAYTNLYGAVQFLQDLDLKGSGEGDEGDAILSNQLSISPEDLRRGLEKSRKQRDDMLTGKNATASTKEFSNPFLDGTGLPPVSRPIKLSVQDVHCAHLKGQTVDLQWAKLQQEQQPQEPPSDDLAGRGTRALPDGFRRSYSFLNAQPAGIRVADLPKLLDEYHMLVQVTEDLLSERAARLAAERKQREVEQQQALGEKLLLGEP